MVRMNIFLELMERIARIFRFFLPWIARLIAFMVSFILTSVFTFWRNTPQTVERIANEWLDRAVDNGFPTRWARQLYFVFYYLAWAMIILGWITLSFITVMIVGLIL